MEKKNYYSIYWLFAGRENGMAKHMEYEMEQGVIREDLTCNKRRKMALRGDLRNVKENGNYNLRLRV